MARLDDVQGVERATPQTLAAGPSLRASMARRAHRGRAGGCVRSPWRGLGAAWACRRQLNLLTSKDDIDLGHRDDVPVSLHPA